MSEIKVNSIKGVGASAAAITVNNTDGTCTANLTNRTNKNLIINGAMNIAQRLGGGVATTSQGYQTVDRFQVGYSGADENLTQMQGSVSSGTTPYTLGFRNTLKITNGNQTSGAGASDYVYIDMALEGQDVAGSGWNYNSASSFITFSFWIKSSVAQSFKGYFITEDGTNYSYAFDTGSLSADTWTKVTKTISGNSNLTINNDTGRAFSFSIWPFIGTGLTDSSVTENAWITHNGSARTKDATSTWWTTNDATFELTGVQLEVSDHATDFEHRSFGQELALCQRYFEFIKFNYYYFTGYYEGAGSPRIPLQWNVEKRATPTVILPTIGLSSGQLQVTNSNGAYDTSSTTLAATHITPIFCRLHGSGYGGSSGTVCSIYLAGTDSGIKIDAEL